MKGSYMNVTITSFFIKIYLYSKEEGGGETSGVGVATQWSMRFHKDIKKPGSR